MSYCVFKSAPVTVLDEDDEAEVVFDANGTDAWGFIDELFDGVIETLRADEDFGPPALRCDRLELELKFADLRRQAVKKLEAWADY
jgi:hypothetical protein